MSERALHVIFGAGQIGSPLARILRERGHEVRLVRRSAGGGGDIPVISGDAADPVFAAQAARGASAIYHCMNPAYDAKVWARELPRIMTSLIAAAGQANARLVVLDNLYMLGATHGTPMNEDTPVAPCSRKGEVRAKVAAMLFEAHRRGDVRAVSGRAADFYGPGGLQSHFGEMFWSRVLAGKSGQVLSDPDIVHTYHFIPDVAAGLATLGEAPDDACGRWWMLPAAPAVTTRTLIGHFARALGRDVRIERMPPLMLSALGLFVPILRELGEMSYQWTEPFLVDDRRFRERFGAAPTPLEEGARQTVAWSRQAFVAPAGTH